MYQNYFFKSQTWRQHFIHILSWSTHSYMSFYSRRKRCQLLWKSMFSFSGRCFVTHSGLRCDSSLPLHHCRFHVEKENPCEINSLVWDQFSLISLGVSSHAAVVLSLLESINHILCCATYLWLKQINVSSTQQENSYLKVKVSHLHTEQQVTIPH